MENHKDIKAVLFDFDGTLVFLSTDYDRMRSKLKELFLQFGIEPDFRPLIDSIEDSLLKLENNISKSLVKVIRERAYSIVDEEELKSIRNAELANGAKEVLSALKKNNKKIGIISRNGEKCINDCISRLNIAKPDLIVSRDDVDKLKPNPEHIMVALNKLKLKPAETIIVGDSYHDITGGRNLNIQTILIADGENKEDRLNPNYTISRLSEIFDILRLGDEND